MKKQQSTTRVTLNIPADIYARIAVRVKADGRELDDLLIRWILFCLSTEEKWGMGV